MGNGQSSWDYNFNIVGESHYQGALTEILRETFAPSNIPEKGEIEKWVTLRRESLNPHDPNAVYAEIDGRKVGYVSRGQLTSDELTVIESMDVHVAAFIGWSRKPIFGVRLDLQDGDLKGVARPVADTSPATRAKGSTVGSIDGRHYTDFVETVKALKRSGDNRGAVDLLLRLVAAVENESRVEGVPVAPWYYEQLAIIYRKTGDREKEVAVLQRFMEQKIGIGASVPRLQERLTRLLASDA